MTSFTCLDSCQFKNDTAKVTQDARNSWSPSVGTWNAALGVMLEASKRTFLPTSASYSFA